MMPHDESQPLSLSIVVPVFNEQATLARVVHKLIDVVPHLFEVVVVDDCSTDQTTEIAAELAFIPLVEGHSTSALIERDPAR